jgi:hypothetical protein
VQVPDSAISRFEGGKVVEISTIQDQLALLKQAGSLPGDVDAAQAPSDGRARPGRKAVGTCAGRREPGPGRARGGETAGAAGATY